MIDVVVSQDEQLDPIDTKTLKTGGRGSRFPPDVDHGDMSPVADEKPIPLTHVASGDLPVVGYPELPTDPVSAEAARVDPGSDDQSEAEEAGGHPGGERSWPAAPSRSQHQNADRHGGCDAENHTDHSLRPRQAGCGRFRCPPRDRSDPGGGKPCQPGQRFSEMGCYRKRQTGHQADCSAEWCRGFGEQIGRHTIQRQTRCEHEQHGLTGQLRCERYGEHDGDCARHPSLEDLRERTRQRQ